MNDGRAASADSDVREPSGVFRTPSMMGSLVQLTMRPRIRNHIAPTGGRTQGRDATLKRVREVHQTFLNGARETVEVWTSGLRPMTLQSQPWSVL